MVKAVFSLTDHVKPSHVSIKMHVFRVNFYEVVRVNSMRAHQESKESRLRMDLFNHIENTHDDIVPASSLTTAQNHSNLKKIKNKYSLPLEAFQFSEVSPGHYQLRVVESAFPFQAT